MLEVIEAMYPRKKIDVDLAEVFPRKVLADTPLTPPEKRSTSSRMKQKSDDAVATSKKDVSEKKSSRKATATKVATKKSAGKKAVKAKGK
jgi:hypothetical protein